MFLLLHASASSFRVGFQGGFVLSRRQLSCNRQSALTLRSHWSAAQHQQLSLTARSSLSSLHRSPADTSVYDARMAEMSRVLHACQDETAAFTRSNIKLLGLTSPDVQHSFGVERKLDDRLMGESWSPHPSASEDMSAYEPMQLITCCQYSIYQLQQS